MLPFIVGVAALAGLAGVAKLAYDYATCEAAPTPRAPKTQLEMNLERLRRELAQGAGPALAILGQPGAGKSSLLTRIGGRRLTPKPHIGIETDATDWSRSSDCVLLLIYEPWRVADAPGHDTQAHPAAAFLAGFPFDAFDAFIFVVKGKLRAADERVYRRASASGKPVLVVRSFADGLGEEEVRRAVQDIRARLGTPPSLAVVPVSNRTGIGVNVVRHWLSSKTQRAAEHPHRTGRLTSL